MSALSWSTPRTHCQAVRGPLLDVLWLVPLSLEGTERGTEWANSTALEPLFMASHGLSLSVFWKCFAMEPSAMEPVWDRRHSSHGSATGQSP